MECQKALQDLYPRYQFEKVRPPFLRNPRTGRNLELDFYCPELRLAVEFQGRQHYVYDKHFHKSQEDFYEQLERDRIKQELCTQHGIRLITVPYTVSDVKEYLRWTTRRLNI
jgi:very-short-patch-repair endonuclease